MFAASLGLESTPASAQDPESGSPPPEAADDAGSSAPGAAVPPEAPPAPPAAAPPPPASEAPPPVVAADPNWHSPETIDDDYVEPRRPRSEPSVDFGLGAQVFNPRGKVMTGPVIRIGKKLVWVAVEFSPIWLLEDSPDFDGSFLGNQWGFHVELAPLRRPRFELLGGLGIDVYHLWGIHGDEAVFGLTVKLQAQFRMTPNASMFATLRGYPLSSSGLELGRDRQGDMLVPILGSLGVEWRWE